MNKIYLDNAATTPIYPEVLQTMMDCMQHTYGNPSSTHAFGRNAKAVIENARKKIAQILHTQTNELVFTSGGTEADNLILKNAVYHLDVKHLITSSIEHHAVLKTVRFLETKGIEVSYIDILPNGEIDYDHLETLLQKNDAKTLVSLMYVNNEIGTILDIDRVIALKNEYNSLFHTDAVQAVGHFDIDLKTLDIDFLAASAHKFHGPKGIGFAYFKNGTGIQAEILGGEQERGTRAGTENIAAILGMQQALTFSTQNLTDDLTHLQNIKQHLITKIKKSIPEVAFNSVSDDLTKSSHTIISLRLPKDLPMLLFQLDLKGIAVSGGSACQSGAHKGSHVLQTFLNDEEQKLTSLRVSFSKFTSIKEIKNFTKELKVIVLN